MKEFLKSLPLIGPWLIRLANAKNKRKAFPGTQAYWEQRYAKGGNSGSGSYHHLAIFKAEILNQFVLKHQINRVLEFGAGDGNQLTLADYPAYLGLDVSKTAIKICQEKFKHDSSKRFQWYDGDNFPPLGNFQADLSLSLDVIFHLVEDEIYQTYMNHLFLSSSKYIIIYSNNVEGENAYTERHRNFTLWISKNQPQWRPINFIKNKYPFDPNIPGQTSHSDFYIFEKNTI